MNAFIKKEWMELTRTGKLLILGIIFIFFGILNPAMAKLTPWLYEMLQDQFSEQGIKVGEVTVTAMTSWTQFYKNTPILVIVMILLTSGILTGEYQKGTLIQIVTKGLSRKKIFFSKLFISYFVWTLLYLVYTGITWGYTAYFWGSDVPNLFYGIFMYWFFGIGIISILMFFGTLCNNSGQVMLATGSIFFGMMLLEYIPVIKDKLPSFLMNGMNLLNETSAVSDYTGAIISTFLLILLCDIMGLLIFDRRDLQ